MRTFVYAFDPPAYSPVSGPTVTLDIDEIENAGVKEVLQTQGPSFGSWALLEALLQTTGPGTAFLFREPLGQSREVKVALSGLFGRFVAGISRTLLRSVDLCAREEGPDDPR